MKLYILKVGTAGQTNDNKMTIKWDQRQLNKANLISEIIFHSKFLNKVYSHFYFFFKIAF